MNTRNNNKSNNQNSNKNEHRSNGMCNDEAGGSREGQVGYLLGSGCEEVVGLSAASIRRLIHCGLAVLMVCGAGAASATPVISEVFYDAVGSDNGQSFVEIFGVAGTTLDGMTLEGVNGANGAVGPIVSLSGIIPADGVFVVADVDAGGATLVANADLLANFDFQNGPDSIVLISGVLAIDAVGYGVFSATEVFAGEGAPAVDAPAGSSLARVFADLDLNDNALDFIVLAVPTPGSVTLLPVPEPASALLAMMGLVGMGVLGRRSNLRGRRARVGIETLRPV